MTMTMARELAGRGIQVNAVAPGFIESDMTAEAEDVVAGVMKTSRRAASASPRRCGSSSRLDLSAAYITGHRLNIDGGCDRHVQPSEGVAAGAGAPSRVGAEMAYLRSF